MPDTIIRFAEAKDEAQWRPLFAAYRKFYRAPLPEEVIAHTWAKLINPAQSMKGLVAEKDGRVIGLCHYLFHENTGSIKPSCYLEDLYVDPAARGSGAARALILACEEKAKAAGAFRLYWQTQEFNGPARSLYDTIVPRSSFIVYRKAL